MPDTLINKLQNAHHLSKIISCIMNKIRLYLDYINVTLIHNSITIHN